MDENEVPRYSVIDEKNKREIVMLRGTGCKWLKCRFCNYHLDRSSDELANYALNREQLDKVRGIYGRLEVINSGSFVDLDENTIKYIIDTCHKNNIKIMHIESHWMHRDAIKPFKERFAAEGIRVIIKMGIETFDHLFRECYLVKGIDTDNPEEIAQYADEVCLLFGIPGQTAESMINDVTIGLKYFQRVCINIMVDNGMVIKPDMRVRQIFMKEVYDRYIDNDRVDILLDNTDFGVGGKNE